MIIFQKYPFRCCKFKLRLVNFQKGDIRGNIREPQFGKMGFYPRSIIRYFPKFYMKYLQMASVMTEEATEGVL